jgi:NAD-dependent SIR2 family protein deacetylase
MIKECKHCKEVFRLDTIAKKSVGGKINECPDCVVELKTETAVRYTGLELEDTGSFMINRHATVEDRDKYMSDLKNGVDLSK